jgi:hypothetical protein
MTDFAAHARVGRKEVAEMKEKDVEDALVELGVRRGMLSIEELYDFFPLDYLPLEELERFLRLLDGLGVKVVDAEELKGRRLGRGRRAA